MRAYRSVFEPMVVIRPVGIRTRSGFRISPEGSLPTAASVSAHLASQTTTRPSGPRENRANWRDLGRLARSPVVVRQKKGPIAGPFWLHMRHLPPRADWMAEQFGFEPEVAVRRTQCKWPQIPSGTDSVWKVQNHMSSRTRFNRRGCIARVRAQFGMSLGCRQQGRHPARSSSSLDHPS